MGMERGLMEWNELQTRQKELSQLFDPDLIIDKVVGVSFVSGYPTNLKRLSAVLQDNGQPLPAELKRDPENKYDSNACQVWLSGEFIGHLSRELAAKIAPQLDAGAKYDMKITSIGFANADPTKPGAGFHLKLVYKED